MNTTAREERSAPAACTATRLAAAVVLAAFALGCQQQPLCEELGDCGGDVTGSWTLGPDHYSCAEDVAGPPKDNRLRGGDVPPLRVPAPEQAFIDWCSGLIAGSENLLANPPVFFSESMPFGGATVQYEGAPGARAGKYSIGLFRLGYFYFDFSGTCMRQFGATEKDGVSVCKQLEAPLRASGAGEGSYQNLTCNPSPTDPAGCLCLFDVAEISGSGGRYEIVNGNQILHLPSTASTSFRATYCRTSDGLQLTGTNGSYLLNKPALRTMNLGRVNCADGLQGPGEDGIDCGTVCGIACPGAAMP